MKYRHQFRAPASVKRVAEFYAHSTSMAAITPVPIVVKVQRAPAVLADGDEKKQPWRSGLFFVVDRQGGCEAGFKCLSTARCPHGGSER
ncbi:MAG: hypothetical protein MUE67_10480 [Anaerolineales bacterium]|jgi:hypothetical protein|nr:hypothetical protein [Anaerolineales bacterium]